MRKSVKLFVVFIFIFCLCLTSMFYFLFQSNDNNSTIINPIEPPNYFKPNINEKKLNNSIKSYYGDFSHGEFEEIFITEYLDSLNYDVLIDDIDFNFSYHENIIDVYVSSYENETQIFTFELKDNLN